MSESESEKKFSTELNEIGAIRSIILGEFEESLNKRIVSLEKLIQKLQTDLTKKSAESQEKLKSEIKTVSDQVNKLASKIDTQQKESERQMESLKSQFENLLEKVESKKLDREFLANQLTELARTIQKK